MDTHFPLIPFCPHLFHMQPCAQMQRCNLHYPPITMSRAVPTAHYEGASRVHRGASQNKGRQRTKEDNPRPTAASRADQPKPGACQVGFLLQFVVQRNVAVLYQVPPEWIIPAHPSCMLILLEKPDFACNKKPYPVVHLHEFLSSSHN